jgi:hypothetical protein
MDITAASEFDRKDEKAREAWNLVHLVTHRQIYAACLDLALVTTFMPVDYDPKNENWAEDHQLIHASLYEALGLEGPNPDLGDLDFEDDEAFEIWHLNHDLLHQQIKNALGL